MLFRSEIYATADAEDRAKCRRYTASVNGEKVCEFFAVYGDHCEMREELAALIDDDFQEGGEYDAEVDDGLVAWSVDGERNELRIVAEPSNFRTIRGKNVPTVASRKVAFLFNFETIDDMLAVAGDNLLGHSFGKLIVRIPADAPLPAGASETTASVEAWYKPVNNHALRCKFADWKKKAEETK